MRDPLTNRLKLSSTEGSNIMFLLIEVDEPKDVGINEISRYIVHNTNNIDMVRVHPATPEETK